MLQKQTTPKSQLNTKACILLMLPVHPGLAGMLSIITQCNHSGETRQQYGPQPWILLIQEPKKKICAKACVGALKAFSWKWITHISSVISSLVASLHFRRVGTCIPHICQGEKGRAITGVKTLTTTSWEKTTLQFCWNKHSGKLRWTIWGTDELKQCKRKK